MDTAALSLLALVIAVGVGGAGWYIGDRNSRRELRMVENRVRDLEKDLHLKERDFIEERNRTSTEHAAAMHALREKHGSEMQTVRSVAFREGREMGLAESKAAHLQEISDLRSELMGRCQQEKEQAISDAREKMRNEYELQTKLFSVKISPYVRVKEEGKMLTKSYEISTGYQYQLLVNGMPAFAPHVLVEQSESRKTVNEEAVDKLVQLAKGSAEAAIQMYLGGSTQFAKLAAPIVTRK